jgi:serine/threonine protein kinase
MLPAESMIGVTLGNYRITAKLGQGGMGAVYLAEHDVLGRKAAIKILLPQLSHQRESVQRFFHEARMTAQLRHPAMVDVFDYGTLPDGRAFLVMDYLEGECLEERIDRMGPMPVMEALVIARHIAVGVSVAHAERIVHRDLKPDNVFLLPPAAGSADERIKILDFGIAKLGSITGEQRLTRAGTLIGTPLYMSPEQCQGDREVDARADIYSLGCILFTMLAGRPPFVSNSIAELVTLHMMAPVPRLRSLGIQAVPAAVEDLLGTLLEKAPERRLPTMTAVALRIAVILQDAGVTTGGPSSDFLPRPSTETLRHTPDTSIKVLRKRLSGAMPVVEPAETVSRTSFDQPALTAPDTRPRRDSDKSENERPTRKETPGAKGRHPPLRPARASRGLVLALGGLVLVAAVALAVLSRQRGLSRAAPPAAPVVSMPRPPASTPPAVEAPVPPVPVPSPSAPAAEPAPEPPRPEMRPRPARASEQADPRKNKPVYRGSRLEIEKRLPY